MPTKIENIGTGHPNITHEPPRAGMENPAVRAIAEDVADAIKYSLTAVAADENVEVRQESLEADFKSAVADFSERGDRAVLARNARERASSILASDSASLGVVFGRHPAVVDSGPAFARQGFDRALEAEGGVDINLADLGIKEPSVTVPIRDLRLESGNLVLPGIQVPAGFEQGEFEEIGQNALKAGMADEVFDADALEELWGPIYEGDPWDDGRNSEFEAASTVNRLKLQVVRVKCEDETNPEIWGNDEIALGGVSIDEDGDTKKIAERYVGGGFKDGRSKTLNWQYTWFNLNERNYWPKKYGVTLILAEKDNGGFSSFLSKLWEKTRNAVLNAIKKAAEKAGVAIGAYLGLPGIGAAIGKILGEAAAWVLDNVVKWIIKLFKDDIFKPFTVWVNLPSKSARWRYANGTWGSKQSPIYTVRYWGFGGRYRLDYRWQLA